MSFQDQLGVELRAATPRRATRRRHSQRRLGALAIVVVAIGAVIGLPGLGGQQPASAAVRVIHRPGLVGLAIDGHEADLSKIRSAAEKAGVEIRLLPRPVGPSLVGRFIGMGGGAQTAVEIVGPKPGYFRGFLVPEGWDVVLDIEVGRAARPGEAYAKVSPVTDPGEPLACKQIIGLSPTAAAAEAAGAGLRIVWIGFTEGSTGRPIPEQEAIGRAWRSYRVADAKAISNDQVLFDLTKDGRRADGTMAEQPDC